ncbi:DUF1656 domain-containing protein [uncultured Bilophila sp.]|uniref:DUF1656 domain-containing protein n=1 Tax=uncultured Bilophila sp. TaxID=529385 RepID=UPI0025E92767|nr:DUF1656 domain-containing protein [uncultured Bilophila sp.]
MPHELALMGVYFSPFLPVVLLAVLGALATAFFLNRAGLSGWFANPPWVFAALLVIYVCLLVPFGMVL